MAMAEKEKTWLSSVNVEQARCCSPCRADAAWRYLAASTGAHTISMLRPANPPLALMYFTIVLTAVLMGTPPVGELEAPPLVPPAPLMASTVLPTSASTIPSWMTVSVTPCVPGATAMRRVAPPPPPVPPGPVVVDEPFPGCVLDVPPFAVVDTLVPLFSWAGVRPPSGWEAASPSTVSSVDDDAPPSMPLSATLSSDSSSSSGAANATAAANRLHAITIRKTWARRVGRWFSQSCISQLPIGQRNDVQRLDRSPTSRDPGNGCRVHPPAPFGTPQTECPTAHRGIRPRPDRS